MALVNPRTRSRCSERTGCTDCSAPGRTLAGFSVRLALDVDREPERNLRFPRFGVYSREFVGRSTRILNPSHTMSKVEYYIGKFLTGVQYSVEHMNVTHWCILGSMSVVLGFLFLRSTNNRI